MSISLRFTDRGDGGAIGPTGPELSSIDREKSCFRLKFIMPGVYMFDCSKYPAIGGMTSASWLPTGLGAGLARYCGEMQGATSWTRIALPGVRIKLLRNGGEHGAETVGGGPQIGPERAARLVGGERPRGDPADLRF